jgi:O-antigen ligase
MTGTSTFPTMGSLAPDRHLAALGALFLSLVLVVPTAVSIGLLVAMIAVAAHHLIESGELRLAPASRHLVVVSVIVVGASLLPFLSNPVRLGGLEVLAQLAILPLAALAFGATARTGPALDDLRAGLVAGALGAGTVAVFETLVLGAARAEGGIGNSIVFGSVALVMGGSAVVLTISRPSSTSPERLVAWSAAAAGLTAGVLSGARGSWLAVPLIVAVVALDSTTRVSIRRVGALVAVVAATSITASALAGGRPFGRIRRAIDEVRWYSGSTAGDHGASTSIGARFEAWGATLDAFAAYPVFGVGWGNLRDHYATQVAQGMRAPRIAQFEHAHNQLLGALGSGGMLGAAAFVALVAVPGIAFWRERHCDVGETRAAARAGLVVVGSFTIVGMTEAIFERLHGVATYAVVVALLASRLGDPRSRVAEQRDAARSHPAAPPGTSAPGLRRSGRGARR